MIYISVQDYIIPIECNPSTSSFGANYYVHVLMRDERKKEASKVKQTNMYMYVSMLKVH